MTKSFVRCFLIVAVLVLMQTAEGADCGASLRHAQVWKLAAAIEAAVKNLTQHRGELITEQEGMLKRRSGFDDIGMRKVEIEIDNLSSAQDSAGETSKWLDQALLLLQLREAMVDQRDKTTVERHLSLVAVTLAKQSRGAVAYINKTLVRISRPGIATDVARLRDSVGAVLTTFENCTASQ